MNNPSGNTLHSSVSGVRWSGVLAVGLILISILVPIFWPTVDSAIYQWNTSSAYNYGYLIAPISAYMIWTERHALAVWRPAPSWLGIGLTGAFAAIWLVGDVLGINEGRQFGFIGILQGLFLAMLGWGLYRRIAFPLVYLWLMVPTGEFLHPLLQTLSHAAAVQMLEWSGVPVFGEGILIQVPSGSFLVEPGCSGLNFLLASIALALLFGKLTYRKWSTRLIALAVAVVTSVLANFVRVYLIVAITEFSNRKINIADDHLFYGWVFFGIVMMAMMWFGMRFKDTPDTPASPEAERPHARVLPSIRPLIVMAAACVGVAMAAPALSGLTEGSDTAGFAVLAAPEQVGGWGVATPQREWTAGTVSGDATLLARYQKDGVAVDLHLTYYAAQRDGREAAARANRADDSDRWQASAVSVRRVDIAGESINAIGTDLRGMGAERRSLAWYYSSGCTTGSRLRAKICAARDRLLGSRSPGAFVVVSTPAAADGRGWAALEDFVGALDVGQILPHDAPGRN